MNETSGRVQDISQRLYETFQRLASMQPERWKGKRRPSNKDVEAVSEEVLRKFFDAAHEERVAHKLGVIGRARVAFGVQQRLLAAGYPSPLVKQVLFAMLASVFAGGKDR